MDLICSSLPNGLETTESGQVKFLQPNDVGLFSGHSVNAFGETYFSAINGHVFESVASELVYDKNLGTQWYRGENQLLLMIGSDAGLIIPYLESRAKGGGRLVIIIELPEMIDWIKRHIDYDPEFIYLQPADHSLLFIERSEVFQGFFYRNSLHVCRSMATIDMFHPAYARLWEEYERELNRFFYVKTIELHGSTAFINAQLRNIADNRFSVHHLYQKFAGGVAILLAGGPSLDDAMDWVRNHREEVTLFAVGRVAARLLQEGIAPDFIVSVDPNDISFDNSKHLLAFYQQSVFLHSYHINPRLLSQWRGLAFYQGHHYPWKTEDKNALQQFSAPGPTVTNTALAFIVQMGFETIVFAGVDLCFKPDGQSHESNSIENQVGRFVHDATQSVKTNAGDIAPTGPSFLIGHLTLQAQIRGILDAKPNIRIINPASSAAFIEGVEHISYAELSLPVWHNDVLKIVDDSFKRIKFDEYRFLKITLRDIQRFRNRLSRSMAYAEKGLAISKVLFDRTEKIAMRSQKLLVAKEKLEKIMGEDLPLLMDYAPVQFNDTFLTNTEKKQEHSDIQASFAHYFTAINASGKLLLSNIDFAIALTRLRQEECITDQLTQELVDQWMRFAQPGRIHHWLARWGRTESDLTEQEREIATPALRAYEAIFKASETGIERKFKKTVWENTLDAVRKAMKNDSSDNIFKLDEILQYCEDHSEDAFYRDLGLLILGYFNQLRGDTEQAYQVWNMVVHVKLRQEALKRCLTLAMQASDYEQSFLALERLSILNQGYLFIYASLLHSLGQRSGAIEVLKNYVRLSPEDIAAQLQLVEWLKNDEQYDAAREVLQVVHHQSPNNLVISRMLADLGGNLLNDHSNMISS